MNNLRHEPHLAHMNKLSLSSIQKAHINHLKWFPKTPIEYSEFLSATLEVPFFFKCDFLQPMGITQIRGAYFMLSNLTDVERKQTITIAAKNEVTALSFAYVAELLSIACVIFLNETDDPDIIKKIKEHKVELHLLPKDRSVNKEALIVAEKMGYLHLNIENSPILEAANGGALAIEMFDQIPQLTNLILPLEDPTIAKGICYFMKHRHPDCLIYGVCDKKKEKLPKEIRESLEDVIFVTEKQKEEACLWMLREHQFVITTNAAAVVAACLSKKMPKLLGVSATILTERSLPFEKLQKLVG